MTTPGRTSIPSLSEKQATEKRRVIVIGAGAAGMMAAGRAAERGARVLLLEKTDGPGKKILISGKSRCNLTNARELADFIGMYGPNGRFLHSAFHRFFRDELLAFLGRYGVETKVERGGRIFPVSDDAADVVQAFRRYLKAQAVELATGVRVTGIAVRDGRVEGVRTEKGVLPAAAVVLATGGATWPATGSGGDGYRFAAEIGHRIVKLRPGLVPLVVEEIARAKSMQGVSLKNVRLTAFRGTAPAIDPALTPAKDIGRGLDRKRRRGPVIESRMGEMLFTHFGIGGPITLLMSLAVVDALAEGPVSISIDLKPALTAEALRIRLQRDFDQSGKRVFRNLLAELLPHKMIDPFVELTGIPQDRPGHQITAAERDRLLSLLKSLRFNVAGALPLASAIVTAGGVDLKEIDPRTMASRLIAGLFFCGEVMDIDADTGGYNLQAAFSTGYIAGEAAGALAAELPGAAPPLILGDDAGRE
ncbi:MAG: aminoacetone oxidase family FAD-binding enzyme [Deltaproteobacteria bacterium]|nr:aminoacetone oxidase family FAD-binding enzyme [Deltaproteobacteria bacterium]